MKIIKKICRTFFNIIIYYLIAILFLHLCLTIYQKHFKKNDLVYFKNYYLFQIASSSMETDLHIGDYIVVEKTDKYKVGDVITFKEDNIYITHRVNKIIGDKIITKGDANTTLDESINKEQILGKVIFKLTILSFIIKYKYVIIVVIIASFIIEPIFKKDKNYNLIED